MSFRRIVNGATADKGALMAEDVVTLLEINASDPTPQINAAVAALVGGAPGALDTLNELAEALGDDADFATTVTNSIAGKANTIHTHSIADVTDLQTELNSKLEASDISNYATTQYVDQEIASISGVISDPSDFSEVSVILPKNNVSTKQVTENYFIFERNSNRSYSTSDGQSFTEDSSIAQFADQVVVTIKAPNGDLIGYPSSNYGRHYISSDNGMSWKEISNYWNVFSYPFSFSENDLVAVSNNKIVVYSNNTSNWYVSEDGYSFTQTSPFSPGSTWFGQNSVIWDGEKFLALSLTTSGPVISNSADGETWSSPTQITSPGILSVLSGYSFSYSNAKLALIGEKYIIGLEKQSIILQSDDAIQWTEINHNPDSNSGMTIVAGEKGFLALFFEGYLNVTSAKIYSPELGYNEFTTISGLNGENALGAPSRSRFLVLKNSFAGFFVSSWSGLGYSYSLNNDGSWTETSLSFNPSSRDFYLEDIQQANLDFDVVENVLVKNTTTFEVPSVAYVGYTSSGMSSQFTKLSYDLSSYSDTSVQLHDIIGNVNGKILGTITYYDSNQNISLSDVLSSSDGITFDPIPDLSGIGYYLTKIVEFGDMYAFVSYLITPSQETNKMFLHYSANLDEWSSLELTQTIGAGYAEIASSGSELIVRNELNMAVIDTNLSLQVVTFTSDNVLTKITYDSKNSRFVGTSQAGFAFSSDGLSWQYLGNRYFTYQESWGQTSVDISNLDYFEYVNGSFFGMMQMSSQAFLFSSDLTAVRPISEIVSGEYSEYRNYSTMFSQVARFVSVIDDRAFMTISKYDPVLQKQLYAIFITDFSGRESYIDSDYPVHPVYLSNANIGLELFVKNSSEASASGVVKSALLSSLSLQSPTIVGGTATSLALADDVTIPYVVDGILAQGSIVGGDSDKIYISSIYDGKLYEVADAPSNWYQPMGGIPTVNFSPVLVTSGNNLYVGNSGVVNINGVSAISEQNVFYVNGKYFVVEYGGNIPEIYWSSDLANWSENISPLIFGSEDPNIQYSSVYFVPSGSSVGLLCNRYDYSTSSNEVYYATSDNPDSFWLFGPVASDTPINLESVSISPDGTKGIGLASSSSGEIFVISLLLGSWSVQTTTILNSMMMSYSWKVIAALSNNGAIIVSSHDYTSSSNKFIRSVDLGQTWEDIVIDGVDLSFSVPALSTGKYIFASTSDAENRFYKSSDGATWEYAGKASISSRISAVKVQMPILDALLNAGWGK